MKGLFVISSLDLGGAQKLFSNILMHLPVDWDIDILLNSDKNIEFPYRGNIISLDIKEPGSRTSLFYQAKVFFMRFLKICNLRKRRKYDFVISAMDSANVVNILTKALPGRTIITILNNMSASKTRSYNKYIVIPLMKLLYNKADKIVALSQDVKDDIVNNFGIRPDITNVIYCSIDLKQLDDMMKEPLTKREQKDFNKDYTIVTAGRMDDQKGQWHLIRAFNKVVQECPEANLIIFGTGMLEKYYKRLIADYHLEDKILLYGFSNKLVKYIFNSAIFVFPSIYEGFGTALQEALACNVACVCTDYQSGGREIMDPDVGDITEIVGAKYGLMVPACSEIKYEAKDILEKSEEYLADAIILLLRDKKLRMAYAKKARYRAPIYDIKTIIKQWIKIFEDGDR